MWTAEQALYHHGILGQKWGHRNGPPYPLDASDHSAAEKKAGYKKSISGGSSSETNEHKGLTDKQKKAIKIGATIVAGCLIAYGGARLTSDPAIRSMMAKGIDRIRKTPDLETLIANSGPEIVKKQPDILGFEAKQITADNASSFAKDINPSKSSTNCGSCAAAILDNTNGGNSKALAEVPKHMRIVKSDGSLGEGYDPDKLIECFTLDGKDALWSETITDNGGVRKKVSDQLEKALISQGNGTKGIFYCEKIRTSSSGHYFFYAIIDNKVHVLEGQSPNLQKTGADYCTNLYDEIGQMFDVTDGATGVKYTVIDAIKPDRRSDVVQDR